MSKVGYYGGAATPKAVATAVTISDFMSSFIRRHSSLTAEGQTQVLRRSMSRPLPDSKFFKLWREISARMAADRQYFLRFRSTTRLTITISDSHRRKLRNDARNRL